MGKRSRRVREARTASEQSAEGARRRGARLPSVRVAVAIVAMLAVAGIAGAFLLTSRTSAQAYSCLSQLKNPAGLTGSDGFATDSLGQKHVGRGARVSYGFCPPTSGDHFNAPGNGPIQAGYYAPDQAVSPLGWVHNLEHGYVVAVYRCVNGTCPSGDDLAKLQQFGATGIPTSTARCDGRPKIVVARFDDMATPFAVLAWDRALMLDTIDVNSAEAFAAKWMDVTAPEKGEC
jgi:hypothetical protein